MPESVYFVPDEVKKFVNGEKERASPRNISLDANTNQIDKEEEEKKKRRIPPPPRLGRR